MKPYVENLPKPLLTRGRSGTGVSSGGTTGQKLSKTSNTDYDTEWNSIGDTNLGTLGTKNPPIDADKAIYRDSAAADVLVTSTWTQVKAFLKTYFDGLYNLYVHPNHSGEVTSVADGAQTIANDAVTYAKIQNVSDTDKVLGRSTAGAGDVEEIACTSAGRALLDDATAAAQATTLGLGTTNSPVHVTVKLSGLADGKIPYHVDDATGFADGPTKTDVDSAVSLKHAAVTVTGPISLSGQLVGLSNDAAAAITEVDTGVLANVDTAIPTSKAVTTAIAMFNGLFEIDINGDLESVTDSVTDQYYELDVNDDIMPKAA